MKQFFANVLVHSSHYLIIAIISFIVLFDKDGGFALGTSIWTATSLSVITIAGILGNLLWIFGLLLLICGIVMFVLTLNDNLVKDSVKEAHSTGKLASHGKLTIYGGFWLYTDLALGIFAIGSGFWFSGIGITLLILSIMFWRSTIVKARDVKLKELEELKKGSGNETRDMIAQHMKKVQKNISEK